MDKLIGYYIRVQNALRNEKGQGMVEYGLILALVAVAVITILKTMGTNLTTIFTTTSDALKTVPPQ